MCILTNGRGKATEPGRRPPSSENYSAPSSGTSRRGDPGPDILNTYFVKLLI